MVWHKFELPEKAPDLQSSVEFGSEQLERAQRVIDTVSAGLDNMPVILSQQGDVIYSAGDITESAAKQLARTINRTWSANPDQVAHEIIRFEEEIVDIEDGSESYRLYSLHIHNALILTAGWQLSISLTQVRAELLDAKESLQKFLT